MNLRGLFLGLVTFLFLTPQVALANGGVFPDYTGKVYLPSQKAVVAWDGNMETLILSTKIKIDDLANVGWVTPIPSSTKPEVEEGSISIFYDLADLFKGSEKRSWTPGVGLEDTGEVEVIEVSEVGIYDVTILKAADAAALEAWLNENGYLMPEGASTVLEEYCGEDSYFIANKVDLANRYADLTVTNADRSCAQEISDTILLYRSGPTLDYQVEVAMEDSETCADANYEAVKVMVELEVGVATPLKITFSPGTPFYPLKLSSINEGETLIDVYVFSAEPVEDVSGLLKLSKMTTNSSTFEESYNLNQKYVTYLYFAGDLSELSGDAWFESRNYDRGLDPNYTSLGGRIVGILSIILAFVLYVGYPVTFLLIFAFAIVGFVVVAKRVIGLFRRKRK